MSRSDHFSGVAAAYAAFRPRYPAALFAYLGTVAPRRELAWDCGAGSGQAAEGLLSQFSRVVATDISRPQLASSIPHGRLGLAAASAEASPLAPGIADLAVVAQALHWLDVGAFYAEVRRIVVPGGVLAVWSYGLARLDDPRLDAPFRSFYDETVGPYWPPQRRLVDNGYRDIAFPFEALAPPDVAMEATWTLDELLGYVGTWSALGRFRAAHGGRDPMPPLADALGRSWGMPGSRRRIRWPLVVRVGRVS